MAKSEDYDTATLLAIGIATVDGHTYHSLSDERMVPGPNTMSMAHARLHDMGRPGKVERHLQHIGWVSDSGLFYNEAQKDQNPHVPLYPVYRLKE